MNESTNNEITLLTNDEAAKRITCAPGTLKQSRVHSTLLGRKAPAHIKLGRHIRYKLETIDDWLNQFKEISDR